MFTLVIKSIWHAIIGTIIFLNTPDNRVAPWMDYVHLDHHVFFVTISLFITIHVIIIAWLFFVPLKHRQNMKKAGINYERSFLAKKANQNKIIPEINPEKSALFSKVPIEG